LPASSISYLKGTIHHGTIAASDDIISRVGYIG